MHTCKLSQAKSTKGHSYQKVQTAPTHPPTPSQKWNYTEQLNVKIYTELQIMITEEEEEEERKKEIIFATKRLLQWSH